MNKEHTIIPLDPEGMFLVKNENTGTEHLVDVNLPNCSGDVCNWQFLKQSKKTKRNSCQHIEMCRGLFLILRTIKLHFVKQHTAKCFIAS